MPNLRTEFRLRAHPTFEALLNATRCEILAAKSLVTTLLVVRRAQQLTGSDGLRAYNPDQPRVPAGNPDGGQWTNALGEGWSGLPIDDRHDSVAGERTEIVANGHHFVPQAVFNALELSPEARRVFSNDKTGPLLGGRHGWSTDHVIYNNAVRERLDQFLVERGIRSQDMSAAQAREFAASIRASTDPRIRGFNLQICRREFLYLIRRYRIRN